MFTKSYLPFSITNSVKYKIMSGLVKLLSGRKRESSVWQHFEYMPHVGKSICKILDSKGVKCGTLINGKNPTNLKVHMCSHHKALYRELEEEDVKKKQNIQKKG
jgi:hypothetical protein